MYIIRKRCICPPLFWMQCLVYHRVMWAWNLLFIERSSMIYTSSYEFVSTGILKGKNPNGVLRLSMVFVCLLFVCLIFKPQKLMTSDKNRKFSKKHFFRFFLFFFKNEKFKTILNEPLSFMWPFRVNSVLHRGLMLAQR